MQWLVCDFVPSNILHLQLAIYCDTPGYKLPRNVTDELCMIEKQLPHNSYVTIFGQNIRRWNYSYVLDGKLKCLRDKVLLDMKVLAMVSEIHLVVGEILIAQHDWSCQDT